jgi:cytochrome c oxidase subunit 1
MYLAVLASMIHGFTVPASVEVAMREKGYTKGLFGWIISAPWRNPAFSGAVLSVVIFGFIGGITGVTLGTQQINIIAHNTLRITGHFHATVVGGTSLAFMALTYYVIPLIFRRDFIWRGLARAQPWLFGGGILLVSFGMSFAGSMGVPRRIYDIDHSGAFGPAAHLMLAVMGVGAIIAVIGLLLFVVLCVGTILFGEKQEEQGDFVMDLRTGNEITVLEQTRHEGRANYAFADGSVRPLAFGQCLRPVNLWAVTDDLRRNP